MCKDSTKRRQYKMNASSFFSVTHVSWHWMSSEWDASDSHLISLPLLHVQSSKPSSPGMTLTAAIPFRGQADRFKPSDRMVYECVPSPHYPHLIPLYEEIYLHKDRTYWKQLEQETAKMAQEAQCKYVDNKKYAHSPKEFYSRASSSIGYK